MISLKEILKKVNSTNSNNIYLAFFELNQLKNSSNILKALSSIENDNNQNHHSSLLKNNNVTAGDAGSIDEYSFSLNNNLVSPVTSSSLMTTHKKVNQVQKDRYAYSYQPDNFDISYPVGESLLTILVIFLWILSIILCCNKYKKLRSLKPHLVPFNYVRYPMHIEEVKIVKNEQDTIIYKKKPSYSKHLNTQAATASLINSYFAPIIYNSSDEYKTAIANRIAAGLDNTSKLEENYNSNNKDKDDDNNSNNQNAEKYNRNSIVLKNLSDIKLNNAFETNETRQISFDNEKSDRKLSVLCKNDSLTLLNQAYKGHQSLDIEYIEMDDLDLTLENQNMINKSIESPPIKYSTKKRNSSTDYINLANQNNLNTDNGSNVTTMTSVSPIVPHHQFHKASLSGRIRYPVGASSTMANRATQNKRNQYAKSKYVTINNNNNTNTGSSNTYFTLDSNNTTTDKSIDSLHHLMSKLEVEKQNENLATGSTPLINENHVIINNLHRLRKHSTAPASQVNASLATTSNETTMMPKKANLLDPQCIPYAVRQSLISLHYQLHKKPPLLQFSRISRSDSYIKPRIKRSTSLYHANLLSEKNNPIAVNKNKETLALSNNKQDIVIQTSNQNAFSASLAPPTVNKKNLSSKSLKRRKSHYEQHD